MSFVTLLVSLTALLAAGPAQAVVYNVNSTGDQPDVTPGDDICASATMGCTLRAAIDESSVNSTNPDIVNVPAGTYQLVGANGALEIPSGEVEIRGGGARSTIIRQEVDLNGDGLERVLDIQPGSGFLETIVTISDVTLADGHASSAIGFWGGVIRANASQLTIERSTITGGLAFSGGGIANISPGQLTVVDSTISGNVSNQDSGGIANIETAAVGQDGTPAELTLLNSTVSGNSAGTFVGGVFSWSEAPPSTNVVTIRDSTITGNDTASAAGGLQANDSTQATVANSIIAGNTSGTVGAENCLAQNGGTIASTGFSIESGTECGFGGDGDQQSTDPLLSALADNGGPTNTHAIAPNSPARDTGQTDLGLCPDADQRGIPRPQGARCDIGAFEFQEPAPPAQPPVAATAAAALVESDAAQLNGTVETNGLSTDSFFEWGPTVNYGNQTPVTGLAGAFLPQAVTATVTGLDSNTTYHYRVRAANAGGESIGSDMTFTTAKKTIADLAAPEVGRTTNVEPVSGRVLVALPRGASVAARYGWAAQKGLKFVPLEEARQIPVGSFVDTKRGRVRVQTATGSGGKTQAGEFFQGLFQVLQKRRGRERGLTEARLKGGSFKSCAQSGGRGKGALAAARKRLSKKTVRRLGANANGDYRSRGNNSSATARGTIWITADRCDGTLTTVKRGKVAVRDFRRKKTVVVKAGKSYLARR